MILLRAAKDWLQLLRQHGNSSLLGFLLGVSALLGTASLWPKSYKGTALLAVNPQSLPNPGASRPSDRQAIAGLLEEATIHQDWIGIVDRYGLYPDLAATGGVVQAASHLASQVSVQQIAAPDLGGDAVRIEYVGTDRNLTLGITEAVASGFTRSIPRVAVATPPTSAEPLYAPVILPTPAARASRPSRGKTAAKKADSRKTAARAAALSSKLQETLSQGVKLQDAFNQNASTLDGLKKQQQKIETAPPPAVATPKSPATQERRNDLQEERLRQELATAQRALADLRQRYTDEYPDVVAASQKVQDIQLDITRLATIAPHLAKSQIAPRQEAEAKANGPDLSAIASQIAQAQTAQTRLQEAIERNQAETAKLQSDLASSVRIGNADTGPGVAPAAAPSLPLPAPAPTYTIARHPSVPTATSASAGPSPFFLVQQATVATTPAILATQFLLPFSLAFGIFAAFLAAWIAERRDPSIRNENMLRHELPASAVYLGGIPRIRHEVIAD